MDVDYNLYGRPNYEPSYHSNHSLNHSLNHSRNHNLNHSFNHSLNHHHHYHHHSSSVTEHYSKDLRQIISSRYCKSYANNHPLPANPAHVPLQHQHCESEINNPSWADCVGLSPTNCYSHIQPQNPQHQYHLCHNTLVADSGLSNSHHQHQYHNGLQTNVPASSSEHVINLYDLNSNRSIDYTDYGHCSNSSTLQESESYHYNQYEDNYYCYNLESHAPITWIDPDYCRSWESDLNSAIQPPAPPPPPHYPSPKTISPMVMSCSSHQNTPGLEPNFTRESVAYKDVVELGSTVPRCALHGAVNLNSSLNQYPASPNLFRRQPSSARLPRKEYKAKLNQNSIHSSMSVNLAMNMPMSSSLIDHKPALSAIQMRAHSAQYKLTAQLSEHITIKKHKFTDVYRVSRNPGKNTLYGQIKHVKINQINTNNQTPFRNGYKYPDSNSSNGDNDEVDRTNLCLICGKTYARPSTLKTHLRTHSGEKPYRCNICNKAFSQAANLTAHIRTHSGEKPFPCPICHRKFSQSSSVTTHLRTHSGERPYRCNFCRKAFSDSSTLTKHLRIHSGEKPYQCRICFLRFSQSGNLNRHMRIHV